MATKRGIADESVSSEGTNEGSKHLVLQQGNDAKRAKPTCTSLAETTLQDLPIEMVERILVRAMAAEVKELRLAKGVLTGKPDPLIDRLRSVCLQWNNILSTECFRNELHKYLGDTARDTIRLQILYQSPIQLRVHKVVAMQDEIFMLCKPYGHDRQTYVINVYHRSRMAVEVKDVIPLPGIQRISGLVGSSESNGLYLLFDQRDCKSVLRITKDDDEESYKISTWITGLQLTLPLLSVSATGSLIIFSRPHEEDLPVVSIYDANGIREQRVDLSKVLSESEWFSNVMQKPNGNLVFASSGYQCGTKLTEIDLRGSLVRTYQSQLIFDTFAGVADVYGRIYIYDCHNAVEIVDSELNLLRFVGQRLVDRESSTPPRIHFNSDRNEIVRITYSASNMTDCLTIFRFTEE